jgi:hypothetical protein
MTSTELTTILISTDMMGISKIQPTELKFLRKVQGYRKLETDSKYRRKK